MTGQSWDDIINPQPQPAGQPAALPPVDGAQGYGGTALAREAALVTSAPEGTRNDTLNTAAFNLGTLVPHILDHRTVVDTLTAAALTAGLPAGEAGATIRSGIRAGMNRPRDVPPASAGPVNVREVALQDLVEIVDEETGEIRQVDFWAQTDFLDHVRTFALARMASPWAVLACVLLRSLCTVPPWVVLPATIGGRGSLNLFAALVGPSGAGKGAADAAARDCVRWPATLDPVPVGSGEGIAHAYAHRATKKEQDNLPPGDDGVVMDRTTVLFNVPEVDTLGAIGARLGSTLMSQLRSAYSGERLGFQYADATRRLMLRGHSYRLGMTVGVQPERSGQLLWDADGGTPQRFVWALATDPAITATPPEEPAPWPLPMPPWRSTMTNHGQQIIGLPGEVVDEIRQAHAARARGEGDALDGHALFTREKVAVAFAALDGRPDVTLQDWDLAGDVMRHSDRARMLCKATLERQSEERREAKALRTAVTEDTVRRQLEDRTLTRVSALILKHTPEAPDSIPAGQLRKKLRSADRPMFEDALEQLAQQDAVKFSETDSTRAVSRV